MIDVHCHLADPDFDADRSEVISRAREAGVTGVITVGEDYESNLRVLDLAEREPFVHPALGHHPWHLDEAAADLPKSIKLIQDNAPRLVAIGEVGLDYFRAETVEARERQRAVFRDLIELARELDLPLSVHVRSAGHYVIDMLREMGNPRAALHAFDGKAKYVVSDAARDLFFSIPGTLLVSRQKQKLAAALPLDQLLLESDAPALSPQRGDRNEPMILARVVEEIAAIKGMTAEEIKAAAARNTKELFELDD